MKNRETKAENEKRKQERERREQQPPVVGHQVGVSATGQPGDTSKQKRASEAMKQRSVKLVEGETQVRRTSVAILRR